MTEELCLEIAKQAIFTCLSVAGPMLVFGLVTGLLVGIIQAVTQIHEMTLTFIPKIIAVAVALILFMPWILGKLTGFSTFTLEKMITLGK
jgi:flagellar biosynthetic protein FliQ